MPDPTTLAESFGEIRDHIQRARARAALEACPEHGTSGNGLHCSPCAADRAVSGPAARAEWARTMAMASCDDLFPRRFRDAVADHADVLGWVKQITDDLASAPSLLLFGETGTGKSHQAYAALRAAVFARPMVSWAATTFPDFAAALRPRQGVDSEAEMDRYRSAGLLLLDDLGTAKGSEWVEEITYRLINGRYEDMSPTIFTTNLTIPELRAALGDRIAGRLAETCTQVLLEGTDWRRRGA